MRPNKHTFRILRSAFCFAVAAFGAATAATPLLDFEEGSVPSEIKRSGGAGKWFTADVTNRFATSGEGAFAFSALPWKKGMNEWPGFTLAGLPITDWRGYDRLVFDMVSLGEGGDRLAVFILGPDGGVGSGLMDSRRIPARGHLQFVVSLAKWPKTVSPDNVTHIHFSSERPANGFSVVLDSFTLLKEGEPLPVPEGPGVWRDILPMVEADRDAMRDEMGGDDATRRAHLNDYYRFRDACLGGTGGEAPPFLLGTASSMDHVLPRGAFKAKPVPAEGLGVRLARNESESLQLVVAPFDKDLRDVRVKVSGNLGAFSATNIACDVVGYVETKERPQYGVGYNVATNGGVGYLRQTRPAMVGWWPDPILGFLDGVDIGGFDVQGFWVRVHCPSNQAAGTYRGTLEVSARDIAPVRIPFSVRVNDFALGRVSALPLAITFRPSPSGSVHEVASVEAKRRDPEGPVNVWRRHFDEWVDFLADYLITYDDIYHFDKVESERGQERLRALKRLRDQGRIGWFNIGHWWRNPDRNSVNSIGKWREEYIPRLRDFYEAAKELGVADLAYAYGCDEFFPKSFESVREAAEEVKKALPNVPVFTTTFDGNFGVGSALGIVDWFCPGTAAFTRKSGTGGVDAARKEGRKVWWYVCDGPLPPYANLWVENQPIEARLLMGAQAVRMKPDGFLYYQISKWANPRCITSGPFTDWEPLNWKTYHGDGQLTCIGPDGTPLPTVRLENFRDGLEDYAYAKILERMLKERETGNRERGTEDWVRRAREALAVPVEVMESMTNFTDSAEAVYRWRDEMADLIEEAP